MPNQHTNNETKLYKDVLSTLNHVLLNDYRLKADDYHIIRIESPSTPGVPDINCCVRGMGEFWIECKVAPNVLGKYQIAWKYKRELAGGKVFVITAFHKTRYDLIDYRDGIPEQYDSLYKLVMRILREVTNDIGRTNS